MAAARPARGTRAKLAAYSTEVLIAALAAETAARNCRPMFVSLLEAEIKRRRAQQQPKELTT